MNIKNTLILAKGIDVTEEVEAVCFEYGKPGVCITFNKNGIKKVYHFKQADVQMFENPKTFDVRGHKVIINGRQLSGVEKIQVFGYYCRIFVEDSYKLEQASNIKIVKNALCMPEVKKCFEYLKKIATSTGLIVEGYNILEGSFEKIDFVHDDSVLAAFLSGKYYNNKTVEDKIPAIYPFGFNLSQKQAVNNALHNKISIIEGPPGTGKTQTILNIIANAVMRGKSVAIVSSNNSATANVLEKLKKHGVEFIAAPLGNSLNREVFIETQDPYLPDMGEWRKVGIDLTKIRQEETDLNEKLRISNEFAAITSEQDALEKEYAHFYDYYNKLKIEGDIPDFSKKLPAEKILAFIAEYELLLQKKSRIGLFKKIALKITYRLKNLRFCGQNIDTITPYCQDIYYTRRLAEIKKRKSELQTAMSSFDFDKKMKNYTAMSMTAFKASLANKYGTVKKRTYYEANDLRKKSEEFIKDYPVVLSTTYSLRSSLSSRYIYDYVIVDEASQVDLATGALAMSCAKKAVIVGDLKQLPNVVDSKDREITDRIFEDFGLPEAYRYSTNSLLSSAVKLFDSAPRVLLKEHYRCHPEIIGFCNQRFYNNELIILTKPKKEKQPLMVYRTAPGNHARRHVNQRQIDVIIKEVFPEQNLSKNDSSVGIVTPYRNQANELQRAFLNTTVKADTADKFQGQERSVMIFSTVDNEIGEFASDPNRLNVAVSRAIDQFIVVTDGNDNDNTSPINELIGYIKYNNHEIINSEIRSVFDYLYENYARAREKAIKKYGRVSDFDSENLMYAVIRDVLNIDKYSKCGVVMHVPLRMIISNFAKLTEREFQFATNHLTHVDFLIYSKLTHQPILVVEVDGFAYHNNEKQIERDQVKNEILKKHNIPILRLSTVGSSEKQKLMSELEKLI